MRSALVAFFFILLSYASIADASRRVFASSVVCDYRISLSRAAARRLPGGLAPRCVWPPTNSQLGHSSAGANGRGVRKEFSAAVGVVPSFRSCCRWRPARSSSSVIFRRQFRRVWLKRRVLQGRRAGVPNLAAFGGLNAESAEDVADVGRAAGNSASYCSQLQSRLDTALQVGCEDSVVAEQLLLELAAAGETPAVIALWDVLKTQRVKPSEAAWSALDKLHAHGKGNIPAGRLTVRNVGGARTLSPGRRLHKIMKGRRMSARSDAARPFMVSAEAWVASERAKGRVFNGCNIAKARISLAKELRFALELPNLEVARGIVTKLKRKKLLL